MENRILAQAARPGCGIKTDARCARLFGYAAPAAAIAGLLLCVPAHAMSGAGSDPSSYDACMAKAGSTVAMETCQQAGLADAERRLTVAYANALKALAPEQQAALRGSERLWIDFRLADCRVFHGKDSGTQASVSAGDCMISRTEHRLLDLQTFQP